MKRRPEVDPVANIVVKHVTIWLAPLCGLPDYSA